MLFLLQVFSQRKVRLQCGGIQSFSLVSAAKQVKGLLKHECYHLVFEHTTQRKHEPHIIWNYGTDCAINSVIPEDELPECGLDSW